MIELSKAKKRLDFENKIKIPMFRFTVKIRIKIMHGGVPLRVYFQIIVVWTRDSYPGTISPPRGPPVINQGSRVTNV